MNDAALGPWVVRSAAAQKAPRAAKPKLTVVAIAQAGTGAGGWHGHGWHGALPPGVELWPVELPGRGSRMDERAFTSMRPLVYALADGLAPLLDGPYVVVGHSFGAWVAYELAQERWRRGETVPEKVYVSGNRAPSLAGAEHDADALAPELHGLRGGAFWAAFERRYGANPQLAVPAIRDFVEDLLLADFQCLETYRPLRGDPPLPVALAACGAKGDDRYGRDQLAAWAGSCAAYEEVWFETTHEPWGTPHRYLLDAPGPLQRHLRADLEANVLPNVVAQNAVPPHPNAAARADAPPGSGACAYVALVAGLVAVYAATLYLPGTV